MEERVHYALIGFFSILLGGALVAIVLWLGASDLRKEYDIYIAYMRESVSGLTKDAPVKYRGVDVGKVKSISLNPENPEEVKLVLEIERGTPIKEDTVAILSVQGLTGIAFVDLTGGSKDAPPLRPKPGEPYPVIKTGPSLFVRLDTLLTTLASRLSAFADSASAWLDAENREAFSRTLAHVEVLSGTLAEQKEVFEEASARLPALMARLDRTALAVEGMAKAMGDAAREARAWLRENRQVANRTLEEVDQLAVELQALIQQIGRVADLIERQPNALVFGRPPRPPGPGER